MYLFPSRFPLTSKELKSYPPLCQEQFSQLDFQGEARCEEVMSTEFETNLDLNPGVATDPMCELGQIAHKSGGCCLFFFFMFEVRMITPSSQDFWGE